MSTILPRTHNDPVWMSRDIKQLWTTEPLRGHLVLSKLQSAWQQDCCHSHFAAMYFCLPPPINTMFRAYFELCRPVSVVSVHLPKTDRKLASVPSTETHFHTNKIWVCRSVLAWHSETTYGALDYEMSVSAVTPHYICQNHYCCGYIRI